MSLLGLYLGLAPSTWAQATFGTVLGTVADSTAAVVPEVTVEVRNQGTNIARTTKTDARGNYEVTHLIPGVYSVTFSASGFKTLEKRDTALQALRSLRIDASLELGALQT